MARAFHRPLTDPWAPLFTWREPHLYLSEPAMIMSEQTKPGEPVEAPAASATEQVPDWLGSRLKRMFTDVMDEPVPDEFKALLKQLEDKERGA
jgi:hypothetical protein